jgi:hypothetical protein
MMPPLIKNAKFNKPPHFSESRIQAQYSSFGFPRNASEYFPGSLATVAAITLKNIDKKATIKKQHKAMNYAINACLIYSSRTGKKYLQS